jgi:hypothetical protein
MYNSEGVKEKILQAIVICDCNAMIQAMPIQAMPIYACPHSQYQHLLERPSTPH